MIKKLRSALSWKGEPLENIRARYNTPFFTFVSENVDQDDLEILGMNDNVIWMHDKFTWANVASKIGLFPSATIARKCGFFEKIEDGYSEAFFSRFDGAPLFVFIFKS